MIVKRVSVSLVSLSLLGAPAFAGTAVPQPTNASPGRTVNSNRLTADNKSTGNSNAAEDARNSAEQVADDVVRGASATVDQVKSDAQFADLLRQAKGVFIVPNTVKGEPMAEGERGRGVLLAHEGGHWSDPAFLSLGTISVGAAAGGEASPIMMLLMSDKAMDDFTAKSNFSLNADADLTIIHYSAKAQGGFGKGDVIIWSNSPGGLISASVTGSDITADGNLNEAFYGEQNLTTDKIVKGHMESAAANHLVNAMPI